MMDIRYVRVSDDSTKEIRVPMTTKVWLATNHLLSGLGNSSFNSSNQTLQMVGHFLGRVGKRSLRPKNVLAITGIKIGRDEH